MDSMRKTALVAGIFYLITFISIATLALYGPVLKDPAYILSSGSDTALRWGALIEVIVALAGIGTAVTLFPVVKRQNEALALGFVTSRVIEGAMILTGVVSLLSLASLHQVGAAAGADSTALLTSGASFVGTYKAAFLIGGTLMPAHECPPARVPDVPIRPRAATHSRDRTRRRRLDDVFRDRTDPRHQREDLHLVA